MATHTREELLPSQPALGRGGQQAPHVQAPGRGRGRPKPTKDVQLWDAILAAAAKQQKQHHQQQQHRKQALHHQRGTPTTARPHAPAAVLATTSTTPSAAAPLAPWASITAARTRGDLQTQPPPAAVAARARSAPTAESSSSSRTPHHHKAKTATTGGGGAATSTHKPKGSVGAPRKAKQHQQRQENTNWASDQRYIAFRGKERETPKPTKPSKLKRVILLERAKADALLQPQPPAPTPPGAPGLEKDQPCDREQLTAPTQSAHADHPDQSDGDISQTHSSKETNASETVVAPGDIDIDYDSPPPSPPPGAAQVQSIDATYCKQIISVELNQVTKQLLQELTRFQERMRTKDPDKARSKKRYVCGLREVLRSVERKKAKCVVVTPNIERISSPEGGLFEAVEAIVRKSQQNRIIVIFAMTRTSLGKAIAKRLKVAALAILDPSGAEEHYKQALSLAHKGRLDYRRMQKRKSAQEHAHEPGQQPLHESARQQQPPPPPLGEVLSELIQGAIEERTRMEQSPDSTV